MLLRTDAVRMQCGAQNLPVLPVRTDLREDSLGAAQRAQSRHEAAH